MTSYVHCNGLHLYLLAKKAYHVKGAKQNKCLCSFDHIFLMFRGSMDMFLLVCLLCNMIPQSLVFFTRSNPQSKDFAC